MHNRRLVREMAVCSSIPCLYLTTLVLIAGILYSGDQIRAQGGCQGNVQELMTKCMPFVQKAGPQNDPTPSCCDVVKNTNVTCVCGLIPAPVEKMISSEKVAHVAQYCGNPIPAGVKCGS